MNKYEPTGWDMAYMNMNREAGNVWLPEPPEPSMTLVEKIAIFSLALTGTLAGVAALAVAIEAAANYF